MTLWFIALFGIIVLAFNWFRNLLHAEPSSPLNQVLFTWPDGTPFRLEDAVRHCAILGKSGAGKTSGGGRQLSQALLGLPGSGGIVFCSKPQEKEAWIALAESLGRLDDLIIFSPENDRRFNLIQFLGYDTREVTTCITAIEEIISRMKNKGTDAFWGAEQKRAIYNAAEMIRLGYGKVSAFSIQQFILTAAVTPDQFEDEKWRCGFHFKTIELARAKQKTAIEQHDFELCCSYWSQEYPAMAAKQRSGVIGMVMTVLHIFNTGVVRELIGTGTNVTPADMAKGKWIIVDLNPEYETGRFILAAWKYAAERWILNRKVQPGDNFCFLWADEAQNLANRGDVDFLAKARSHQGGFILLTQAYSSLLAAMGGENSQSLVDTLLSNFSTFIMHQLDPGTADYASKLLGMRRETFVNISPGSPTGTYDALAGGMDFKPSYSETYQPVLQNGVFMSGDIRTGGKSAGYLVDGYVISSKSFKSGERYLKVAFKQR